MKLNHTPGTWKIVPQDYETINIVSNESNPRDRHIICCIPSCVESNEDTQERKQRAEANAQLIAHAPNLLDALLKIDKYSDDALPDGIKKIIANAIKKATQQYEPNN